MTKLETALALAAEGFHVFPLERGSKIPRIDSFPTRASRDPDTIRAWWTCPVMEIEQGFNIAVSTTRYQDDAALLVVDIDNKDGKHGDKTIADLAAGGEVLPPTRETRTPSGGRHLFYSVPVAVSQTAGKLGSGVDTRSRGGYVVATGSDTAVGAYVATNNAAVVPAPEWLVAKHRLGTSEDSASHARQDAIAVDPARAESRAIEYLKTLPPAAAGERNHKGFVTAANLKDFGVEESRARDLMQTHWKCDPALDFAEVKHVVRSAYRYGRTTQGAAAPESQFPVIHKEAPAPGVADGPDREPEWIHPFENLNREFAFTLAGGGHHILWETVDETGGAKLEHLSESSFHRRHASQIMQIGKKQAAVTELWMSHKRRRSYDGLVFMPGEAAPERFYNLWRGFAVQPAPVGGRSHAVDAFLEHALQNVCRGEVKLFRWLIGFFAHMVQRPNEKPHVALVLRGAKGVGKNSLVEIIGALFGQHFLITAKRRYLLSNFNGHLESCLFFVLNELFWAGDKQAESELKDLITGDTHAIEHKGKEIFKVANRTRVAILGNEDWIVPASHDERRYAVFDVGEGRKQDHAYFIKMREGMERGGYAVLLRYLLDFSIYGLNFNDPPKTKGLLEQKHASLEPVEQWWYESLMEGSIVGGDFEGWPDKASTARIRAALNKYFKDRQIRVRAPDANTLGRTLTRCAELERVRARVGEDKHLGYAYVLPNLKLARERWEHYIGHQVDW